jgi:putative transcriptional regulator
MFRYKVDIISRLKEAGYSTYRLQKEKLLATTTLVKLRNGNTTITLESLNAICDMLECQPGDLIEWYRDESSE